MYKLVISDTVKFQVKLTLNDAGTDQEFPLLLVAQRIDLAKIRADIEEHGAMPLVDYQTKVCRENVTGWQDQRLVVDQDGNPAPFSPEAFDAVIGIPGVAGIIYPAYMESLVVNSGTAGRAKN